VRRIPEPVAHRQALRARSTRLVLIVALLGLSPTLASDAAAGECASRVILFTVTGVYRPATGHTYVVPVPHSGFVGCGSGVADTHYVYPGATHWAVRHLGSRSARMASMTGIVNGSHPMRVVPGTVPGTEYAETPWHAWDPTALGHQVACVEGDCNTYRTIDR